MASSPPKLKVVTLVDQLAVSGGAERLAMDIARRLDADRFEPIICVSRSPDRHDPGAGPVAPADLEAAGVRVLALERTSRLAVWNWYALFALLRREDVAVLHAHKFGSNIWGTVIGSLAGVPVIVAHEHGAQFGRSPIRRLLDRHLIARGTDAFIAVSRQVRRSMVAREGISPDDVVVIPSGIRALRTGDGGRVRQELGIEEDELVVGAVSRLRPEKALDLLIRAVPLIDSTHRVKVLIAGEGSERRRLESLIADLRLHDTVRLLGLRGDVPDLLAAFDVAVLSSEWEGAPLAVLEYMAAARPIVAARVGGLPDLIDHGVHGLLVEPGDSVALAAAIGRLLRDPEASAAMGARARERQQRDFRVEALVARLERLYEQLWTAKTGTPVRSR